MSVLLKKAFTLLELIIVVVILGILASLALPQYAKVAEKARSAEAKHILGMLRSAQMLWYTEYGSYAVIANLGLSEEIPDLDVSSCAKTHYFLYYCRSGPPTGDCFAMRCGGAEWGGGGKPPDIAPEQYYIYSLTIDGQLTCYVGPCP